jgi:hypothetical protein
MKDHVVSSPNAYLVLFSNTHVVFLDRHEHGLAEALNRRNANFRSGVIEPVAGIPSGVKLGKIYRHCAPAELNLRYKTKPRH